ncbi:MAG: hypothetical protein LBP62_00040 [Clostridiales bacterium]|nr:hypothetical protein [Clostridiales bacterium]
MKTKKQKILKIISVVLLTVILSGLTVVFAMDVSRPYYQIFVLYTWNARDNGRSLILERREFIQIIMSSRKDEYALMIIPKTHDKDSAEKAGDPKLEGEFDLESPPLFIPLVVWRDEEAFGRLRFILPGEYEEENTGDIGLAIDFMLNCHIYKNKYLIPDKDNPYIYISPEDFLAGTPQDALSENVYPQKFAVKTILETQSIREQTTQAGLYQFYGYTEKGYVPNYVNGIPEQLYLENGKVYDGAKRAEGYRDRFEPVGNSFGRYAFEKGPRTFEKDPLNAPLSKDFLNVSITLVPTAAPRYLYFQGYLFNAPTEIKRSMLTSTFFCADTKKVRYDNGSTMIETIGHLLAD